MKNKVIIIVVLIILAISVVVAVIKIKDICVAEEVFWEPELPLYNDAFYDYLGSNVKKNRVQELISKVIKDNEEDRNIIEISFKTNTQSDGSGDIIITSDTEILKKIKDDMLKVKKYEVKVTQYNEEGWISAITITEL